MSSRSGTGLRCPDRGGGDGRLLRAAVLALGGRGRKVAGQARGAGLHRRRVTEHHLPAPGLDHLVRHHDEEVHHGHQDEKGDDRGDEGAEFHERLGVAGPDLHAEPVLTAREAVDERGDEIGGEAVIRVLNARATTRPTATTITSPRIRKYLNPLMSRSPIRGICRACGSLAHKAYDDSGWPAGSSSISPVPRAFVSRRIAIVISGRAG